MGKGLNCTKIKFHEITKLHEGTKLHKNKIAWVHKTKFALGNKIAPRVNFAQVTLFYEKKKYRKKVKLKLTEKKNYKQLKKKSYWQRVRGNSDSKKK